MLIIPAIDLKDGNCVRLRRGEMDDATIFSDDPVATAKQWYAAGAKRLHLVDLNGAFAGKPVNADAVQAIHSALPDFPLQIGGGIRDFETIEYYLQAGVSWVIIGTKAVQEPEFVQQACKLFPGRIIVGIDARNGLVATNGWAETTQVQAVTLAKQFANDGVSAIVYTDIDRDGMMQGVNVEATKTMAVESKLPIIASGGITNMQDIEQLMACNLLSNSPSNSPSNLPNSAEGEIMGAITGRAIYEGTLDLTVAQNYCDELTK